MNALVFEGMLGIIVGRRVLSAMTLLAVGAIDEVMGGVTAGVTSVEMIFSVTSSKKAPPGPSNRMECATRVKLRKT